MKFTKAQKAAAEEAFKPLGQIFSDFSVVWGDGQVEVKQMYEHIQVDWKLLSRLAEIFGTRNINTSTCASAGCETCDYGSSYEVTFYIKPEDEESSR